MGDSREIIQIVFVRLNKYSTISYDYVTIDGINKKINLRTKIVGVE